MDRENCWEFKKCGREPGGNMCREKGICPAAEGDSGHGINGGTKGGRLCWAVAGTFCGGKVLGEFAQKEVSCMACDFFKKVKAEEGNQFVLMKGGKIYQTPVR